MLAILDLTLTFIILSVISLTVFWIFHWQAFNKGKKITSWIWKDLNDSGEIW